MKNGGVIRFCAICIVCISVVFYNGERFIFRDTEKTQTASKTEDFFYNETVILTEKEPEKEIEEKAPEQTVSKEEKTEVSQNVSASAVKGKVISKYISPYSAPLSYNKVYMKNSTSFDINIKKLLNDPLSFKIKKTDTPKPL